MRCRLHRRPWSSWQSESGHQNRQPQTKSGTRRQQQQSRPAIKHTDAKHHWSQPDTTRSTPPPCAASRMVLSVCGSRWPSCASCLPCRHPRPRCLPGCYCRHLTRPSCTPARKQRTRLEGCNKQSYLEASGLAALVEQPLVRGGDLALVAQQLKQLACVAFYGAELVDSSSHLRL